MENIVKQKACRQCGNQFPVTDVENAFYKKMAIPSPTLCPHCREQRRLVWRNERHLYYRNSDLSGKPIISTYAPHKPYKVYSPTEWWSDSWNALDYGRDFDFSRSFFEQFDELLKTVPQIGILNSNNQNAEYDNFSEQDKNCYLVFAANRNEDCYYSSYIWDSKNCVDNLNIEKCELCYECVDCFKCYNACYSERCRESHDITHCFDLSLCENCFACAGMRGKKFHILNKPFDKNEYQRITKDPLAIQKILQDYEGLKLKTPRLFANLINCENSTGSNLRNCRNVKNCFDAFDMEDCHYVENGPGEVKDVYDMSGGTHDELGCELVSIAYGYNLFSCLYSHNQLTNAYYCIACPGCQNCFGCVGLKNQKYCIFNKQYSEEEFSRLASKIIEHMKRAGEWGEFFPAWISPYAYNESISQERYPLTKEEALRKDFRWLDESERGSSIHAQSAADNITIFACSTCNKNFKIIEPEQSFYKKMNLPLPKNCPECRHRKRFAMRNPCRLYSRPCSNCQKPIQSTYSPDRPEIVYCESCYLKEVY